jgi:hypothetical protein
VHAMCAHSQIHATVRRHHDTTFTEDNTEGLKTWTRGFDTPPWLLIHCPDSDVGGRLARQQRIHLGREVHLVTQLEAASNTVLVATVYVQPEACADLAIPQHMLLHLQHSCAYFATRCDQSIRVS